MRGSLVVVGRHVRAAVPFYRLISYVVALAFVVGGLVGFLVGVFTC